MKNINILTLVFLTFLMVSCDKDQSDIIIDNGGISVDLYFPPAENNTWDTTSPDSLDWDKDKLATLRSYLDQKGTKGFIILKDGKIVVEEYFDNHTMHSNWNWYSAAKSFTAAIAGVASSEGLLDIDSRTSDYLGVDWSVAPRDKQDLITVKHHMTMSTGLQNSIGDFIAWTCTNPLCMKYQVDAGTRWSYHQGAFTLTQDIISSATGVNFNQYGKQKIQDKIGMNGSWNNLLDVRIFSSTTRSMARFGLLALNEGKWDDEVIYPSEYHESMISASQKLNKSYGYLWWLNGKESFLGTGSQTEYNGNLIPNAPKDMYAALGAQDQKIYVVPSQNIVVVRCGEPAGNPELSTSSFDNELWGLLDDIFGR